MIKRLCVCMSVCVLVCVYICTFNVTSKYVSIYVCMYVCMYVCVHVCVYVCMSVHVHLHVCICNIICTHAYIIRARTYLNYRLIITTSCISWRWVIVMITEEGSFLNAFYGNFIRANSCSFPCFWVVSTN